PHRSTRFPYTTLFRSRNTQKHNSSASSALNVVFVSSWLHLISKRTAEAQIDRPPIGDGAAAIVTARDARGRDEGKMITGHEAGRSEEHTSELQSLRHL